MWRQIWNVLWTPRRQGFIFNNLLEEINQLKHQQNRIFITGFSFLRYFVSCNGITQYVNNLRQLVRSVTCTHQWNNVWAVKSKLVVRKMRRVRVFLQERTVGNAHFISITLQVCHVNIFWTWPIMRIIENGTLSVKDRS